MAAALYMDAVIAPNRSMGGVGFKVVVGVLAGMAALISLFFFAIGAWPAPLFLGLDVVLVYIALKASNRALNRRERLRVSAETVEVIEEVEGASRTVWSSPTAFTTVDLEALGEHEMRVRLRLSGRRHSVGKALSPPERESLGQALREAIRLARQERHLSA
ncbi:MAG: DUF2244 domain-containing protein [Caulobacter sp.]|nr:DUF2244 domain-containing protein [Caulobacter sp.]